MRTFLACAGAHGNDKALARLLEIAAERKPDAILFAGGIKDPKATPGSPQASFYSTFFESLGKSGHTTLMIPGPHDAPLWAFFSAAKGAELVHPNLNVVHATPYEKGQIAVCGVGGVITESEDTGEPTIKYSHPSVEFFCRSFWRTNKPSKILLLSEPPTGRLGGDSGNRLVLEFIKSYHPALCVVSGSNANRGAEREAHGVVVNPGLLTEGSAAWIDMVSDRVTMLDL